MRRLCLVFAFACSLSVFVSAAGPPPQSPGLSGVVRDGSGLPLPGVLVVLRGERGAATDVTDASGRFSLPAIVGERYVLVATLEGFARFEQQLTARASGGIDVALQPASVEEQVVVTATRAETPLASLPVPVTVITRAGLDEQLQTSPSLGDALGKLVPGLAAGSQSQSIFGQTLRGRNVLVLIDGVPQSAIRNVSRDLSTLDPSAIERIEVVRGASAIFGDGASGGIINIITRRPAAEAAYRTEIGTAVSLTGSDTPAFVIRQDASGSAGRFAYRGGAALERTRAFFDAEGDRLPPDPHGQGGLSDTRTWNLHANGAYAVAADQQLRLMINVFDSRQDTSFASDPAVKRLPAASAKSAAIAGLHLPDPQNARQVLASVDYQHGALGPHQLHAQAYFRDFDTRFFPFDGRAFAIFGRQIYQSYLDTTKGGLRIDVDTRLSVRRSLRLIWGADLSRERTRQPVTLMSAAAYDASGGLLFEPIGGREWVPLMEQRNLGAFAQLEAAVGTRLLLRGGLRAEHIEVDIPSFVTLAAVAVEGDTLAYRDALFNGGMTFFAKPWLQIFGQASQGFAVPDIGLVLRGAPAGASVATLPFEPQKIDSFDAGVRGSWRGLRASLSAFYNRSDLGSSSGGFNQPVVRAPERIYGVETELDAVLGAWRAGGTLTWLEGKSDPNRDGVFTYLNSYRIAPPKLTLHAGFAPGRWQARVQALYSGERQRFPGSARFGERPVRSYTVVDAAASVRFGPGDLRIGVDNVLNVQYFVRESQLLRTGANDSHTAARGAALTLAYAFGW